MSHDVSCVSSLPHPFDSARGRRPWTHADPSAARLSLPLSTFQDGYEGYDDLPLNEKTSSRTHLANHAEGRK